MQVFSQCPEFDLPEDRWRAQTLCLISNTVLVACLVMIALVMALFEEPARAALIVLLVAGAAVATRLLTNIRHLEAASVVLPALLWVILTVTFFTSSGVYHPALVSYVVVIVIVALLVNGQAAVGTATLTVFTVLMMVLLEDWELVTFSRDGLPPSATWVIFAMNIMMVTVLVHLAVRTITDGLRQVTESETMLRDQNQRLEAEITERLRVEAALRSERDLLSRLTDYNPVGILRFDTEGKVIYANPHIRNKLNIQEGDSVHDIVPYDYEGRLMPKDQIPFEQVKSTNQRVTDFYVAFRVDDELRYFSVTAAPLLDQDGQIEGVISIQLDVTERVHANKQTEHYSQLQSLISHISTRFINISLAEMEETIHHMLGSIGAFLGVDRCFVLLLDEDRTTFSLKHEWVAPGVRAIMPIYEPVQLQEIEWVINQLATQEVVEFHTDQQHEDPGVQRLLDVLAAFGNKSTVLLPLKQGGQLVGGVGFDSVQRERTWVDEEIILLKIISQIITNAYDRRRIDEQSVELARVQDRVRLLQEFISNISHDIKTPLTAISSNIYLLKHVEEEERRQRYFQTIEEQIIQLDRLIQDILTISRLEAAPTIEVKPVDMNQLTRVILSRFESMIERKRLNISSNLDNAMPHILGDVNELDRAITHVLQNAVNYTAEEGQIKVRTFHDKHKICLVFSDNGIGISEEDQVHIFERFYRADPARNTKTGGTGLGLPIAKRIIELHQGQILVESSPGEGSTFTIELPLINKIE